ncbi:MAG: hypothetical protein FD126_86 [Elusimicrobia bacterium]|nr:MAG: hypothetical protein FD126_86 [Elusimicrobiota bacterium]
MHQEIARALIGYGTAKLPIIPLCSPSLPHQHGHAACKHPGKVPLEARWQDLAVVEMDQVRYQMLSQHPYNFGLPIPHDLIALDPDTREDEEGLARLLAARGLRAWRQRTGKGGHFILRQPEPGTIRNSVKVEFERVRFDIRGVGGQIVVWPSVHVSGTPYQWIVAPWDIPRGDLSILPEEFLLSTSKNASRQTIPVPHAIPEGGRNSTLTSLAGTMRKRGMTEDAILAALMAENLAKCAPPLDEAEVRAIVSSISRYPAGSPGPSEEQVLSHISLLSQPPAPQWPDDLAKEAFHGLAGQIVETIEPQTEADPVAILTNLLVAIGSVIGAGPHFRVEKSQHALRLFAVLVGESSKARKGLSWNQIPGLIAGSDPNWPADNVTSGLSSGEGLIWHVRDPISQQSPMREKGRIKGYEMVQTDPGIEDKRLLVVEPEFARTLKVMAREGNVLSAVIRAAWDDGNLRVLTKSSPAVATGAHISIIGHITKTELLRYLDSTEAGNGFANRFIWMLVRRSKALPEGGGLPDAVIAPLREAVARCVGFATTIGEIKRDAEAKELWAQVYQALSDGKPGLFGAVIGRAEAQVMRLACLYAVLDCSDVIRVAHLQAALAVWKRAEDSAQFIFGGRVGDPVADKIMEELKISRSVGLSLTEISKLFGRHESAERIGKALALLREGGMAYSEKSDTEGRPEIRWFIGKNELAAKEAKEAN